MREREFPVPARDAGRPVSRPRSLSGNASAARQFRPAGNRHSRPGWPGACTVRSHSAPYSNRAAPFTRCRTRSSGARASRPPPAPPCPRPSRGTAGDPGGRGARHRRGDGRGAAWTEIAEFQRAQRLQPRESPDTRINRMTQAQKRATPGGYGGKPPGVAIIGVPTGARNAGSGAPTGDQSTDMNGTRLTPRMCQDLMTTKSRDAIPAPRLPRCRPGREINSNARDRRFLQCRALSACDWTHSVPGRGQPETANGQNGRRT